MLQVNDNRIVKRGIILFIIFLFSAKEEREVVALVDSRDSEMYVWMWARMGSGNFLWAKIYTHNSCSHACSTKFVRGKKKTKTGFLGNCAV